MDRPLFEACAHVGGSLPGEPTDAGALHAVTAAGRWRPAPTHGPLSGMQEATMAAHDAQFGAPHTGVICMVPCQLSACPLTPHGPHTGAPHTGLVYTAPTASDHIGVSLVLAADCLGSGAGLGVDGPPPNPKHDAATRACSFRPQAGLASFWGPPKPTPKTVGGAGAPGSTSSANNGRADTESKRHKM